MGNVNSWWAAFSTTTASPKEIAERQADEFMKGSRSQARTHHKKASIIQLARKPLMDDPAPHKKEET